MPLTTSTLNKKYNQNIQQVYKKQPRILRFVGFNFICNKKQLTGILP